MRVIGMRSRLVFFHVLTLSQYLLAREDPAAITPQDCSLGCVLQGGPECEYCRVNGEEIEKTRGVPTFGSCVPLPCVFFLGSHDSVCQHYVHAPDDVTVEFLADQNPKYDNILVRWKPSVYGIGFLRGFQVSLQAVGGSHVACQLFLFHINISLPASHAQKVYQSDPFKKLDLGARYTVTVMALPVTELWANFDRKHNFSTRTCPQKNGLEHCKRDWYPEYTDVRLIGRDVIVTFNLAPPLLKFNRYFSKCYTNRDELKEYTIEPDVTINQTHSSYHLKGLKAGSNYTCEIAVDQTDAVRKKFKVPVIGHTQDTSLPLALLLPVVIALAIILLLLSLALTFRRKPTLRIKSKEVFELLPDKSVNHDNALAISRATPPRLLICYSSSDGPAHVRAVMQLATFLQQHMATQVFLDLWDSLQLAEDGIMGWYCKRIEESDFVLVICSRGLRSWRSERYKGELSTVVLALIGGELSRAKATGRDISKYMAAIFEYSEEEDIPLELGFVSRYMLTRDFPLLFSHIHGVALHRPGVCLQIEHINGEGCSKLPAWIALQGSIHEASKALSRAVQRPEEG
ncbi:hypothetical protein DPEC_G00014820 [Dallia pectoralis]|uniref:Uncharacterized protein n=1 Tax=Dallia pectoralis TaxID=75939 RepID=A0ACC2HNB0_DALPE|nr:hypothetical protein DPEC_G00014820 [Dallia pectoralis]